MKLHRPAALVLLGVASACGGAAGVDFFDKSSAGGVDGGPVGTPTTTSPTAPTTTTDPTSTVTDDDAAPPPPTEKCTSAKDCGDGFACDQPNCRGDGRCVPEASFGAEPVCGCDKLTYLGSLPRGTVRHAGECQKEEATPCSQNNGCSGGAKCNMPVAEVLACAGNPVGTCWRLPSNCPSAPRAFRACASVPTCTSACEAASASKPYYKAVGCP